MVAAKESAGMAYSHMDDEAEVVHRLALQKSVYVGKSYISINKYEYSTYSASPIIRALSKVPLLSRPTYILHARIIHTHDPTTPFKQPPCP